MKPPTKTILCVSVHREDDNPEFGESVTKIAVQDEAAGGFLHLSQCRDDDKGGLIFDLDELEYVATIGRELIEQYEANDPDAQPQS